MTTLKEHIAVLQKLGVDGVPTRELGEYFYHFFNDHLAGDKGDHLADPTGDKITIEQFFLMLDTPDPPEPTRRPFRAIKGHVDRGTTPQGTKMIQGLRNPEPRAKA